MLDMINICEQPAFNCLLLTWRCLTEGKESPRGLSNGVSGCRSVCACAVLHAGHACTFVPADATLIANSTQPLCKRCLFSFQGPSVACATMLTKRLLATHPASMRYKMRQNAVHTAKRVPIVQSHRELV